MPNGEKHRPCQCPRCKSTAYKAIKQGAGFVLYVTLDYMRRKFME